MSDVSIGEIQKLTKAKSHDEIVDDAKTKLTEILGKPENIDGLYIKEIYVEMSKYNLEFNEFIVRCAIFGLAGSSKVRFNGQERLILTRNRI